MELLIPAPAEPAQLTLDVSMNLRQPCHLLPGRLGCPACIYFGHDAEVLDVSGGQTHKLANI